MRSFRHQPDNRRSIYLNLVGAIESQFRQAFAKRHDKDGMTQAVLAKKLGVDRSAVNRRLSGGSNMTIETVADMVWGLGHCIRVEIYDPTDASTNHFHIVPETVTMVAPTVGATPKTFTTTMEGVHVSGSIFHYQDATGIGKRELESVA